MPAFTVLPLNPLTAERFSGLTFSAYGERLRVYRPDAPFVAIGATVDGEPAGLACGFVGAESGDLLSVFVCREWRQHGIGTALVRALERELRARRCDAVATVYETGQPGTPAFERTLRRCGWPTTGSYLHVFVVDGRILSAPWVAHAGLPPSYCIEPWGTVTPHDLDVVLESHAVDPWIPSHLMPQLLDARMDARTSLVLRGPGGAVVGWLLTSPFDTTTIRYDKVYVQPTCHRVGRTLASLALVAEATRRQMEAYGIDTKGRFEVAPDNLPFLRFIQRHWRQYLISATLLQRVGKHLKGSALA